MCWPIQRAPAQKAAASSATKARQATELTLRSQRPRRTSESEVASHVFSQVLLASEPVERLGHYEIVIMIQTWVGLPSAG